MPSLRAAPASDTVPAGITQCVHGLQPWNRHKGSARLEDKYRQTKCLIIVDYASSYQVMVPLYEVETSEVLHQAYMNGWLRWAGPPVEVLMNPGRTNTPDSFVTMLEQAGTRVLSIAAEAHNQINQLGKVEKHGHLLEVILQKVLDQTQIKTQSEYEACVMQTANNKNELINNKVLSPCQLVFGRNSSRLAPRLAMSGVIHDTIA